MAAWSRALAALSAATGWQRDAAISHGLAALGAPHAHRIDDWQGTRCLPPSANGVLGIRSPLSAAGFWTSKLARRSAPSNRRVQPAAHLRLRRAGLGRFARGLLSSCAGCESTFDHHPAR